MAERKFSFYLGDRVRFRRMHDKATELTGEIVGIHPCGAGDLVDVKTEVDGKKVEVSGVETVHAADLQLLDETEPGQPAPVSTGKPASKRKPI